MKIISNLKKVNPMWWFLAITFIAIIIAVVVFGVGYGGNREYFGNADGKLVFYGASWCGFCTKFKPEFKQLGKSHTVNGKTIQVIEYDADKHPQKIKEAGIEGFPTVHLYMKDGKKKVFNGDRTITGLKSFLKKNTKPGLK
jgi:thiol-disulfide isomerase/thioredoxin